jgi:mannonate dehydratase
MESLFAGEFQIDGRGYSGAGPRLVRAEEDLLFTLRDVEGTREHFRETFHDNGPVDLAAMLRIYDQAGFVSPMRPDHAPTLDGEKNDRPGYAMGGKVLAIGYMKGVMDAYGIQYE